MNASQVDQILLISTLLVAFLCFIAIVRIYPLVVASLVMVWGWISYSLIEIFSISGLLSSIFLYLDEIFILTLFSFTLAEKIFSKSIKVEITDVFFIGFLISGLTSSVINNVPLKIALLGMFLLSKGYLLYWSIINSKDPVDTNKISKPFNLFCFIIILGALVETVAPTYFRNFFNINTTAYTYRFGLLELRSFFTTSSVYGWFMSIGALYYFSIFSITNKKKYSFWALIFSFFTLLSLRAKAVLSMIISITSFFIVTPKKKQRVSQVFLIFLLIVFFSLSSGNIILKLVSTQFDRYIVNLYSTDIARNILLRTSINIANNNFPLGTGFGRFGGKIAQQYYSPVYYQYRLNTVYGLEENGKFLNDTFWPCVIGETGYIGTLFFILFIGSILFTHILRFRKSKNEPYSTQDQIFYLWSLLILIAALVDSIAQPIFTRNPQYFLIFLTLGYAFKLSENTRRNDQFEKIS